MGIDMDLGWLDCTARGSLSDPSETEEKCHKYSEGSRMPVGKSGVAGTVPAAESVHARKQSNNRSKLIVSLPRNAMLNFRLLRWRGDVAVATAVSNWGLGPATGGQSASQEAA